jgi:hypothetical protein
MSSSSRNVDYCFQGEECMMEISECLIITAVIQVTGLKQKVIDLLRPWVGKPTEVLDQNVKSFGSTYHI